MWAGRRDRLHPWAAPSDVPGGTGSPNLCPLLPDVCGSPCTRLLAQRLLLCPADHAVPPATASTAADDGTDVFVRAIKPIKKGEVRWRQAAGS